MTVTTSSRRVNEIIDNISDERFEDPASDEYKREFYGIIEPLTGEALDQEIIKIQRKQNDDWEKNKTK